MSLRSKLFVLTLEMQYNILKDNRLDKRLSKKKKISEIFSDINDLDHEIASEKQEDEIYPQRTYLNIKISPSNVKVGGEAPDDFSHVFFANDLR